MLCNVCYNYCVYWICEITTVPYTSSFCLTGHGNCGCCRSCQHSATLLHLRWGGANSTFTNSFFHLLVPSGHRSGNPGERILVNKCRISSKVWEGRKDLRRDLGGAVWTAQLSTSKFLLWLASWDAPWTAGRGRPGLRRPCPNVTASQNVWALHFLRAESKTGEQIHNAGLDCSAQASVRGSSLIRIKDFTEGWSLCWGCIFSGLSESWKTPKFKLIFKSWEESVSVCLFTMFKEIYQIMSMWKWRNRYSKEPS